jgi:hypothetical protein
MIIGRRTFILGTGFVASAPALALHASLPLGSAQPRPVAGEGGMNGAVFKIHGWEDDRGGDQLWISINQSWRTAWR